MNRHAHEKPIGYLDDNPEDELALETSLTQLAEAEHLIVALDFDGTLSPLVSEPEAAQMLPDARKELDALVEIPNTTVALISGRAIESLKSVANPDERIILIGSHGAEIGEPHPQMSEEPHEKLLRDTVSGENALQELLDSLQEELKTFEGILFETKPYGIAVHFRNVPLDDQIPVNAILAEHILLFPTLVTRTGKMVLEFSKSHSNKGDSLRILSGQYPDTALFFAGDDLTDEDIFRVLPELSDNQIGVKLGPGDTHARFRLRTLEQLPPLLMRLVELRTLTPKTGMTNPEASI